MSQPQQPAATSQPTQPPQQSPVRWYYHAAPRPTDAGAYAVLPLDLLFGMSLPWQHGYVHLMETFHDVFADAPWPDGYRAHAVAHTRVTGCDEQQLAAARIYTDLGDDGELLYAEPDGSRITDPHERRVYVPVTDPLLRR